jgi:hypothetical protein
MENAIKYVYVRYDPLLEVVLCVHEKPDTHFKVCNKGEYKKRNAYQLCQKKLKLKP